jgi:protein-S-isoprenylcysteine O-methyltransferase Ste14
MMKHDKLELRVPPLVVVLLLGALMWLAAYGTGPTDARHGLRWGFAIFFAVLGILVVLGGVWEFRRARTTVDPRDPAKASSIVTRGVYRFTRNPMYLGFLCLLVGWAAVLWSPLALAGPLVFVAYLNRFQIEPEERMLRARFGAPYEEYLRRVRRWL